MERDGPGGKGVAVQLNMRGGTHTCTARGTGYFAAVLVPALRTLYKSSCWMSWSAGT